MSGYRKIWLAALVWAICCWNVQAQSTDPRFRIGTSLGFEGTSFINNGFNNLVTGIHIPGITGELNGRVRFGKHFTLQLSPAYNIRPYRSHRVFIGDSLNPNGTVNPQGGKLIDRTLRGDLYEARLGLNFFYHFKTTNNGFYIGAGMELQSTRLRNFEIVLKQDSVQFLAATKDLLKLPMLVGAQLAGGYTWALPNGMLLQAEPYVKYSPLFTKDAAFLSWGTGGVRLKWWL